MLIESTRKLEEVCRAIKNSGAPLAFDTEFVSERRYRPALFLVQIGVVSSEYSVEAIVDPLKLDLAPFLELIADQKVEKILHSGSQDLQILWDRFGCPSHNVFDTQIAAAFLGFGNQISYVELARKVGGAPVLSKDFQYSDWAARPLSEAQLEYAIADVRYLPAMHAHLRDNLAARGRLEWVQTEFQKAESVARAKTAPDDLYKKLNVSRLSRRQLGNLREMAIVRDEIARSLDKPPSFILPDLALAQLAKQPPRDTAAMRASRGVPSGAMEWGHQFVAAAGRAGQLKDDELPDAANGERPDAAVDNIAVLLGIVAGQRADEQEIARNYLAPRDQLLALASWCIKRGDGSTPVPDVPILSGWRREILGGELLELLDGKLTIGIDPQTNAVHVMPREVG